MIQYLSTVEKSIDETSLFMHFDKKIDRINEGVFFRSV